MTRVPAASDPLADQPFPLSELWEAVLLCSMPHPAAASRPAAATGLAVERARARPATLIEPGFREHLIPELELGAELDWILLGIWGGFEHQTPGAVDQVLLHFRFDYPSGGSTQDRLDLCLGV